MIQNAADHTGQSTFAYLRLSLADDDGKDESNSISSQRECIREYCRTHGIAQDYRECVDDGYSGTNFERPGFQKLLKMVRAGVARVILVKDLSRLGRNYLEVGYYLEYIFPYYNVRIIAVNDNYDSKSSGESTIGLEVAIRNLMNDCYSRDISKKISSSVHLKKTGGEYVYGTAPFGYKKGEKKNTIVVDEKAAETVRRIFMLAASGTTVSQIAKLFNEEKVITPSKHLAPLRPNYKIYEHWSYESVRNILTNRIYTGDTETYKSHVVKVGSDRVKQIPEKERTVVEDTHEPIVSRELYERARSVIKSNVKSPKKKSNSILTGMLFCGCCGGRLVKGKESNRHFYCVNARYRPDSGCKSVRPEENRIKEIILKAAAMQMELLHEKEKKYEKIMDKEKSEILQMQREQGKISNKRKKLMDEKLWLYEQYADGKLDKEKYLAGKQDIASKDEKLAEQEEGLAEKIKKLQDSGYERKEEERELPALAESDLEKGLTRELLGCLVQKVVVKMDGGVEIYWNFMDEVNG